MQSSRARDFMSYRERRTAKTGFWRFIRLLVLLYVGYLILTHFFIASYTISSAAMEPGLRPGDVVLTTPLLYGPTIPFTAIHLPALSRPARGDVVIATPPYYREPAFFKRIADSVVRFFTLQRVTLIHSGPAWEHPRFVKRVLGIPGDTIRMIDFVIYVRPRGQTQFAPEYQMATAHYDTLRTGVPKGWKDGEPFSGSMRDVTLGPNQFFLVGDNRVSSIDSRYFGVVTRSSIMEKVLLRYYPLKRLAITY